MMMKKMKMMMMMMMKMMMMMMMMMKMMMIHCLKLVLFTRMPRSGRCSRYFSLCLSCVVRTNCYHYLLQLKKGGEAKAKGEGEAKMVGETAQPAGQAALMHMGGGGG